MDKQQKHEFVDSMRSRLQGELGGVFLADFTGVTVAEDHEIRGRLRKAGVEMKVVKNTLFHIAAKDTPYEGVLDGLLTGPSAVMLVGDVVEGAKALKALKKDKSEITLSVKGGALAGTLLSSEQIETLASLPNREQLIGQFMGLVLTPLRQFATVLQSPLRDFANVVKALEDKKRS